MVDEGAQLLELSMSSTSTNVRMDRRWSRSTMSCGTGKCQNREQGKSKKGTGRSR
jgi:hypothetical protein